MWYTTIQKFEASKSLKKEILTFVHQGCIKLIKNGSKTFIMLQKIIF